MDRPIGLDLKVHGVGVKCKALRRKRFLESVLARRKRHGADFAILIRDRLIHRLSVGVEYLHRSARYGLFPGDVGLGDDGLDLLV